MLNLPAPVVLTLSGIVGLLTVASMGAYGLARVRPENDVSELTQRTKTWWAIVIPFVVIVLLGPKTSIIGFGLLSYVALKEYLSIIPTRQSDRRILFWAYLAIALQYTWIYIGWYGMFLIFIPIYMFLFLPMRMVILGETQRFLQAVGTIQWGLMLTTYTIGHLSYLRLLPTLANTAGGAGLLVFLVVLTEVNDIAQYIAGKLFGQTHITPTVSPGKTVEGLLGGVLVTTGLAIALAPWLTPLDTLHALMVGPVLSLVGFAGDVTLSALKRDLGIKDTGTLLPGHGGILDRIDSLIFTAPVFFHFIVYVYYRGQFL